MGTARCSCVEERGWGLGGNISDCLFSFFSFYYWLPPPFEGYLFSSDFFFVPFLSLLFSFSLASLHGENGVFLLLLRLTRMFRSGGGGCINKEITFVCGVISRSRVTARDFGVLACVPLLSKLLLHRYPNPPLSHTTPHSAIQMSRLLVPRLLPTQTRARLAPSAARAFQCLHLHSSAPAPAIALPITAHGPPPKPPLPAGEIADLRRRQKLEAAQDLAVKGQPGKGRFWKEVKIINTDGSISPPPGLLLTTTLKQASKLTQTPPNQAA